MMKTMFDLVILLHIIVSFCDKAIYRDLVNDSIVVFDWTTSIVTDENEEIAIRCQCGKDILDQIGNGTIFSELCGPKIICDSLCMYQERDCTIAPCNGDETALYDVCVFQTLLSVSELVTIIIHGAPCNIIVDVGSKCDENNTVTPSSNSDSNIPRIRNVAIFGGSIVVIILSMLIVVIGCTINCCKLKGKKKR